jgi:ectoine hydroxylase-related dioxygenase (phytanoyl-CoA dioxygenase family)
MPEVVFTLCLQDAPAWTTFNQKRHLTAMVAVDRADEENGCMWMVKGAHARLLDASSYCLLLLTFVRRAVCFHFLLLLFVFVCLSLA